MAEPAVQSISFPHTDHNRSLFATIVGEDLELQAAVDSDGVAGKYYSSPSPSVVTGIKRNQGGSSGDRPMDSRLINLERDMTDVKVAVGKVETRLQQIESHMLSKGQAAIYLLLAGVAIFGAGWWIVQQYLAPILSRLPPAT